MILCSSATMVHVPFEDAIAAISKAGFHDIDLLAINTWAHINPAVLAADFERVCSDAERVFKQHNVRMQAMNVGLSHQMHDRREASVRQNLLEMDALCRFMRHFGVRVAALQPLQNDPARPEAEVLADCTASLAEYYACAKGHQIALGLELHVNSPFETRESIDYLFNQIPDATVVYDPTHFVAMGQSLCDSECIIKNAIHVHIRDAGPQALQAPLGKGTVDFEWVINKLSEIGYQGSFSIEYIHNSQWDALAEAVRLHELLESMMKKG